MRAGGLSARATQPATRLLRPARVGVEGQIGSPVIARALELTDRRQRLGEVEVGVCVVRNQLERALERLDRAAAVPHLAAYDAEVTAMIDYIYASKAAEGVEKVLIPGDPERQSLAARSTNGIDIDDNSWQDITHAANAAGLGTDDLKALL